MSRVLHSNYTERLQIVLDATLRAAAENLSKIKKMSLSELVRYWIAKEAGLLDKKKSFFFQ